MKAIPALLVCALAVLPVAAFAAPIHAVNAEDLAPLPGGRWVIASSMAGGAEASGRLLAIDTSTGRSTTLYPNGQDEAGKGDPSCDAQVAPAAFKPHGIALVTPQDGEARLYVVNHGGRESIEIFSLRSDGAPKLRWIGCVMSPKGLTANSVAALPDGRLFVTNMGRPIDGSEPLSADMGGEVASWSAARGWQSVPGSALVAPNGLLASPDGSRLYVASWSGKAVIELTPGADGTKRRTAALDMLPDNLRWSDRGTILVGGQSASVQGVIDCYLSTRTPCAIPSAIAEIGLQDFTAICHRAVRLGMATVAAQVGREIWVGTTRGDSIERLTSPACPVG